MCFTRCKPNTRGKNPAMPAKMLINAGITEIVYQNPYPDELSQELLAESGILVREYTGE